MIETLTVQEATELLRSYGMKISVDTLGRGLQQGVYPFGIYIQGKKDPIYQIFRVKLDKWVLEHSTPDNANPQ